MSQQKPQPPQVKTPMTKEAAARIQAAEAKAHGGKVAKGGVAARVQSTADRRAAREEAEASE